MKLLISLFLLHLAFLKAYAQEPCYSEFAIPNAQLNKYNKGYIKQSAVKEWKENSL